MKKIKLFFAVVVWSTTSLVLAEAPVTDLTSTDSDTTTYVAHNNVQQSGGAVSETTATASNLTDQQRLALLEQKIKNLNQMNLPQQINGLQQQLQQLTGQLQQQAHELKVLNQQQRSFYQDLDTQINQIKSLGNTNNVTSNPLPKGQGQSIVASTKIKDLSASAAKKTAKTEQKVDETRLYNNAFKLLRTKQYDQSISAFKLYLDRYPNGVYTANAYYWVAEILFSQKKWNDAKQQFSGLLKKFPTSDKVADSQLKLALIEIELGNYKSARSMLKAIKKKYPNSTVSQLASIQIQKIDLIEQTNL